MGSFSIAVGAEFAGHSVDSWRTDPELKRAMAYSTLGPNYLPGAKMFFRVESVGDMVASATVASSALAYETIPTRAMSNRLRHFCVFMANKPRRVTVGDESFVQHAGECVLSDSAAGVAGEYREAHAGLCLSIPFALLERHLPVADDIDCLRMGSNNVLSSLISRLLVAVWSAVDSGRASTDGVVAADALLKLLAHGYGRVARRGRVDPFKKLRCEQIKELIGTELRNPALSVHAVAERIGVTTRYLQLLFAEEGECASEYIRRERLRACLLDLRHADFDHQSITDIAFSWGFNSAAHFSSAFRKEFGLSPRDYRHCDLDRLAEALAVDVEAPFVQALQLVSRPVADADTDVRGRATPGAVAEARTVLAA
ncbi:MAG: helix-turn-helix domain-containing protein [Gammaproteobacteria bacterium]